MRGDKRHAIYVSMPNLQVDQNKTLAVIFHHPCTIYTVFDFKTFVFVF